MRGDINECAKQHNYLILFLPLRLSETAINHRTSTITITITITKGGITRLESVKMDDTYICTHNKEIHSCACMSSRNESIEYDEGGGRVSIF